MIKTKLIGLGHHRKVGPNLLSNKLNASNKTTLKWHFSNKVSDLTILTWILANACSFFPNPN